MEAAQRSEDFLLLNEVRYFFWTFCHFGLHLPSMKLDQPKPSDWSLIASCNPNRVEYEVAMIGRELFHL